MSCVDTRAAYAELHVLAEAKTMELCQQSMTRLAALFGADRFFLVRAHSGIGWITEHVLHDAPPELAGVIDEQGYPAIDYLIQCTRRSYIPFRWDASCPALPKLSSDSHYQSGISAHSRAMSGQCALLALCFQKPAMDQAEFEDLLGGVAMTASFAATAFDRIRQEEHPQKVLTERETECLIHVLAGRPAKLIARALGISVRTVDHYLECARAKMGTKTSYAAASIAVRRGWIDVNEALDLANSAAAAPRSRIA